QAYLLENVMPLSRGYGSISLTQAINSIPELEEEVITSFTIQGPENSIALFVATESKAFVYDPNGGVWAQMDLPYTAPDKISYAYLKETTYIHYGYSIYVYNFTSKQLEVQTLNGVTPQALEGITSAGSFLI